jgi:hypothetical protein
MASIYRFSFEHDIVPPGVNIASGSIWSGQGRLGANTNALTTLNRSTPVWTEVNIDVPSNSSGIRGSFYTKASGQIQYEFRLLNGSTSQILFNGNPVIIQDLTLVEDNRWNLVRFSVDFNGSNSTGSIEFNGIRVDSNNSDVTTGISSVNLTSIPGTLSSLDDVGINDNTGTIPEDTAVPNAIVGFVGGLVEDGDIQNWQQNVASLFPLNYLHEAQGLLLYVPSFDKLITVNQDSPVHHITQNEFTILNGNTFTTESVFTEVSTSFCIQTATYNDADGLVYLMGTSSGNFAYKTYDPSANTTSSVIVWTGSFDETPPVWIADSQFSGHSTIGYEYRFRDVLATTYCPYNSKIYSLVAVYNPYYPHTTVGGVNSYPTAKDDYVDNMSWIQMLVLDPRTNKIELSYKYYGSWVHFTGTGQTGVHPNYSTPKTSMIWNPNDQTLYAWCSRFNSDQYSSFFVRSIEPDSLTIKKAKSIRMEDTEVLNDQLASGSGEVSVDLCYCNINNSIYMTSYQGIYDSSQIFIVDLASRTGSLLYPNGIGSLIRKLVYTPAKNAIYALGEIDSFVFDPINANYAHGIGKQYGFTSSQWLDIAENGPLLSGSILESVPLYNIQAGVYVPKNSSIIAASYEKVYRLMGSMESSVVNALISPDSLKAGATASGDVCTLKIAKPTGSFTSQYRYEGFNIRIDNASSLATASMKMGIREAGVNVALGAPIITWANSTGSHVRSVFTSHNSGSSKWSGSQFDGIQFYMEAGDPL